LAATALGAAGLLGACVPKTNEGGGGSGDDAVGGNGGAVSSAQDWVGQPADLASLTFVEELDTEVLICGAGHGGIIATLVAAEQGAKTLTIEKGGSYGTLREYIGVVNAQCQKDVGCHIDSLAVTKELMRYASYRANQGLIKQWADKSGETLDWVMSYLTPLGFNVVAETDVGDGFHDIYPVYPVMTMIQTPTMIASGMPHEMTEKEVPDALVVAAEGRGAEFRFNTALVQCIVEDGKVTGAVAVSNGSYIRINASKGVLIATGGYEGNFELIQTLQPRTAQSIAFNTGFPQNIGEGIKAGIWAGGRKDEGTAFMLFDRGGLPVDGISGLPASSGDMFWMGSQPWLKVNLKGKRFCNESAPYDFPIHAVSLDIGSTWCPIWDANWQANIVQFHTLGCSRIDKSSTVGMTQSFLPPIIEGMNGGLLEKGYIQQADTIEALAQKLGLPASALKQTVTRYNELVVAGDDSDFGKPAKDLIALDTPPFFGIRQGAQSLCSLDGLRVNTDCAVINADDDAISGLWAAGNVSGGFFSDNYPELVIGVACGRTMTQARHAVLNMLGKG
jgi:hypothetical protein